MQNRSTETPGWKAEALKRDALILAILRAGPVGSASYTPPQWKMPELQELFRLWRIAPPEQRALFLRHARADGTFAELDGGPR
jgi:hypothetical protein